MKRAFGLLFVQVDFVMTEARLAHGVRSFIFARGLLIEAEFGDIVTFVHGSEVEAEFQRLVEMPLDAREDLARRRRAAFERHFSPSAIFERAQIPALMSK